MVLALAKVKLESIVAQILLRQKTQPIGITNTWSELSISIIIFFVQCNYFSRSFAYLVILIISLTCSPNGPH